MNEFERARRIAERMKEEYPAGTRVQLISMEDPRPIPSGSRGTVQSVDDMGTIHIQWDNGRFLGCIPGEDNFRTLTQEELNARDRAACGYTD